MKSMIFGAAGILATASALPALRLPFRRGTNAGAQFGQFRRIDLPVRTAQSLLEPLRQGREVRHRRSVRARGIPAIAQALSQHRRTFRVHAARTTGRGAVRAAHPGAHLGQLGGVYLPIGTAQALLHSRRQG